MRRMYDLTRIKEETRLAASPVVIIIADGWPRRVFAECLSAGVMPEIEDYLLARGVLYPNVVSVFPSVSLSSHTTILTGVNPQSHGIPGHRWLDSGEKRARIYLGPGIRKVNADIASEARTVFERWPGSPSVAIQSPVSRGATRAVKYLTMDSEVLLRRAADAVTSGLSPVVVVWLPKGDAICHGYGPGSERLVQEIRSTSRGIGALGKKLRESGLLESARILLTSDHGSKAVRRPWSLKSSFQQFDHSCSINESGRARSNISIFTNGDSSAYLYFDSHRFSTDAIHDILTEATLLPSVDLAFLRVDAKTHNVISRRGVSEIKTNGSNAVGYRVLKGIDPLNVANDNIERTVDITTPDYSNENSEYPDVIHQYLTCRVPGRSANVILTARDGFHFGVTPRVGFRFGYHRGSHGGPTGEEVLFSAIATGPQTGVEKRLIRSKDLLHALVPETANLHN